MSKFIVIGTHRIYLRGNYAKKYNNLEQLEKAKAKEANRWNNVNPKLAEAIRNRPMIQWLSESGAIFRKEEI